MQKLQQKKQNLKHQDEISTKFLKISLFCQIHRKEYASQKTIYVQFYNVSVSEFYLHELYSNSFCIFVGSFTLFRMDTQSKYAL